MQDDSNSPSVSGTNGKYYSGKTGVTAEFKNFPRKVFYYEDDAVNSFDFGVNVHNEGTSLTTGATYISGYDPHFLEIEGQIISPNEGWGDCNLDITGIGDTFADWSGMLDCALEGGGAFDYQQRGESGTLNFQNFGLLGEQIGLWDDSSGFFDTLDFGVNWNEDGLEGLNFNFDVGSFSAQLYYHGTGFVAILVQLFDFSAGLGREYTLAADNNHFPGGGQEYLDYHADIKSWPPGLDEFSTDLLLTNCYGYVTYASPLVCIDPMPHTEQQKTCTAKTITMSSQGAPVAVTKIEQENTRKKSIFTIHIKNVGSGDVINWQNIERCSPYYPGALLSKHKNVVYTPKLIKIENQVLDCNPEGTVRLDENGEGIIVCTYELEYINLQSAYKTPLIIEFWYGYQETDRESILFKRV